MVLVLLLVAVLTVLFVGLLAMVVLLVVVSVLSLVVVLVMIRNYPIINNGSSVHGERFQRLFRGSMERALTVNDA